MALLVPALNLRWWRKPPKRTPLVELERIQNEERRATREWDRIDASRTMSKRGMDHPLAPRVGTYLFDGFQGTGTKCIGKVIRIGEHPHAPDLAQIWVDRPWKAAY